jgi:hypothetical protein
MRQKIATTWGPAGTEGFERSALIYFRIHRNGSVSNGASKIILAPCSIVRASARDRRR